MDSPRPASWQRLGHSLAGVERGNAHCASLNELFRNLDIGFCLIPMESVHAMLALKSLGLTIGPSAVDLSQ